MSRSAKSIARTTRNASANIAHEERAMMYAGPIPHPEILKGLHELNPEYDKMVMDMAMNHAKTADDAQSAMVRGSVVSTLLGQIFAFVFGLAGLGVCVYLAIRGITVGAVLSAVVVVVQTVVAGVANHHRQ